VAKASFQWRYFIHLIQDLPLSALAADVLRQFPRRRWSNPGSWLLVTAGSVALLYWNGRLVLATGMGVAVMLLVYLMHDWQPRLPWAKIRKFLQGWDHPLVLAVGAGGVATFTTYLAASIWVASESHWIASGAILQGAGTLSVLGLLIWQMLTRPAQRQQVQMTQLLADLTHADPLRRLIAVRQLTHTVPQMQQALQPCREIADCFRLMLSQEQEPLVREAVLEGLQALTQVHPLKQTTQPAVDPVMTQRSPQAKRMKSARASRVRSSLV